LKLQVFNAIQGKPVILTTGFPLSLNDPLCVVTACITVVVITAFYGKNGPFYKSILLKNWAYTIGVLKAEKFFSTLR
jgi:hypothetical protein